MTSVRVPLSLSDLEFMDPDEIRQMNLYQLLFDISDVIVREARNVIGHTPMTHYGAVVEPSDIVAEVVTTMVRNPEQRLEALATYEPSSRAGRFRSYLRTVIAHQWPRIFHARYCSVGEPNVTLDDLHADGHDIGQPGWGAFSSTEQQCRSIEDTLVTDEESIDVDRSRVVLVERCRTLFNRRQHQVLYLLVVEGMDTAAIATRMGCGRNNVYTIRANIRKKLAALAPECLKDLPI